MKFKDALLRRVADEALMRKAAAAILTPEAEQAAVQGGMGAPADPAMAGGMPPQGGMPMDPSMMGGAPGGMPQGPNGGQLPPEIMQDQGFIQWLQQQGIMFDPQSGMFIDPQSGQPLPAEVIMQAYDAYQQEMAAAQGGAQGGQPPMDPAMAQGGAPMDPSMAGGQPPVDPSMMGGAPGGMPPQDAGQLPPEVMQDEQFAQFMEQAVGAPLDPNAGTFVDPQSGQPLPPEMIMQAYQAYQQQMGGQGGMPQEGGMPADPAAMQGGNEIPPEVLEQIQSVVDASIENFTSQIDKKIEILLDKLETVKMALEAMRDTDDQRAKDDKEASKALQDEIAAELNPEVKTAAEVVIDAYPQQKMQPSVAPKPLNMFDYIVNRRKV